MEHVREAARSTAVHSTCDQDGFFLNYFPLQRQAGTLNNTPTAIRSKKTVSCGKAGTESLNRWEKTKENVFYF